VRLDEPELTISVEVLDGRALFFTERIACGGGLPAGAEGRGIALLSGGFDSAVAAWMMLKRGMELDYVSCNLGGPAHERSVLAVAKLLADGWSFGTRPLFHAVDFAPLARRVRDVATPDLRQVVLRRLMHRAAGAIARSRHALALVTGDSLGQVSSQTAANLRAIDGVPAVPVLRPLVGFDKQEIVARARSIGTHALSERVREHCAIAGKRPAVAALPADVDRVEAALGDAELARAVRERRVLDLRALERDDLVTRYLYVDEVPPGATVLDVRPDVAFRSWHWPGAVRVDLDDADDLVRRDREPTYVLCCERGAITADLALRLQQAGLAAYAFRGGASALRRLAERGARGSLPETTHRIPSKGP
jgi:thiamine biosynthesis protein ThiI